MLPRTTTIPARPGGGPSSSHRLLTVALTVAAVVGTTSRAEAETCYRDETGRIVHRRQPGFKEVPCPPTGAPAAVPNAAPGEPGAPTAPPKGVPAPLISEQGPSASAREFPGGQRAAPSRVSGLPRPEVGNYGASIPLPDRWRIAEMLPGYKESLFDPYNRNPLKADKPMAGSNPDGGKWFFNFDLISDTQFEDARVPTGVAPNGTVGPGDVGQFGGGKNLLLQQNILTTFTLFKGDTVFQPPTLQFRVTPVLNFNRLSVDEVGVVNADPRKGTVREDGFVGVEEAFAEARLRVVSDRFDFDSVRAGIQPFNADFRGFLFQDDQLGLRLFGTRDNNIYQYNLAYFRLLKKDTNSGLNRVLVAPRHDDVIVANLYRQDTFFQGFTNQVVLLYNRDRESEKDEYNKDGFLVIPSPLGIERARDFDVGYVGYNTDGHIGRYNLTTALYYEFGRDRPGTFVNRQVQVRAGFAAAELSRDFSWLRVRLSGLYSEGDKNPYGNTERGFDPVFENPQFAGADTSFFIAEAIPFVAGGGVALTGPNSVVNDLRSSKDEGQSNFANPGTILGGIGVDADVLPQLRISVNANDLFFADTRVLEIARQAADIDRHIGYEAALAVTYRPMNIQNVVIRVAGAHLFPGEGFKDLFPGKSANYLLANLVLSY